MSWQWRHCAPQSPTWALDRAPTVAEGLKTISAPLRPNAIQFRVVSAVADVNGHLAEGSLEHRVTRITLHIVGALVEVTDAGNMVLTVLADNVAPIADNYRCVPDGARVLRVAFQDRTHDHHVVFLRHLLAELCRRPILGTFGERGPGSFSRVQKANGMVEVSWKQMTLVPAWRPRHKILMLALERVVLLRNGCVRWLDDGVLCDGHAHEPRVSSSGLAAVLVSKTSKSPASAISSRLRSWLGII